MSNTSRLARQIRILGLMGAALVATIFIVLVVSRMPKLVNDSPSEPRGIYLVTGKYVGMGDVAETCLPAAGAAQLVAHKLVVPVTIDSPCAHRYIPLLKTVVAIAGDRIRVDSAGVYVNDRLLPDTKPQRGYRTAVATTVPRGMILGIGKTDDSFDGRYFGPTVPIAHAVWILP